MTSDRQTSPEQGRPYSARVIRDFLIFCVATIVFFAVGIITSQGLDWYSGLVTPAWTPPELVIAAIWGTLFVTTVVSLSLYSDAKAGSGAAYRNTVLMYVANALLILFWNYVFFGAHLPLLAVLGAGAVGATVLALIMRVYPASHASAWLLVPYLAWVVYAVAINYAVFLMN